MSQPNNTPSVEGLINKKKDLVAQILGYPNWKEMYDFTARDGQYPSVVAQLIEGAMVQVAELIINDLRQLPTSGPRWVKAIPPHGNFFFLRWKVNGRYIKTQGYYEDGRYYEVGGALIGVKPENVEYLDESPQPSNEDAMRVLESLTPGGSEFYNDPERCALFIIDQIGTMKRVISDLKQLPKSAAQPMQGVEEAARKAIEHIENDDEWIRSLNIFKAGASWQAAQQQQPGSEGVDAIVSDEEMEKAFGYSNFGSTPKREVLIDSLLKTIEGYHYGQTANAIITELGLIKSTGSYPDAPRYLTEKGIQYLKAYYTQLNAKEHAIAFVQWMDETNYERKFHGFYSNTEAIAGVKTLFTLPELYTLWQTENNNSK